MLRAMESVDYLAQANYFMILGNFFKKTKINYKSRAIKPGFFFVKFLCLLFFGDVDFVANFYGIVGIAV